MMKAKHTMRVLALLLCIACMLPLMGSLIGCFNDSKDEATETQTDTPTAAESETPTEPETEVATETEPETVTNPETVPETATETESATEAETEPETESETEPETAFFNEGKVEYATEIIRTVYDAFDETGRGQIMATGKTGVVSLFDQDFEDGDPNCGGKATSRADGATGVYNGKLYIPWNGTDGIGGGWTTWCPEIDTNFTDYSQIQLSATMEVSGGSAAWLTGFIGCYVSNYTATIPDNGGDGIWFSFISQNDQIGVFGSDRTHWAWPAGNTSVQLWKGALSGQFHVDIICEDDRTTTLYIGGRKALYLTISEGRIHVYDYQDALVYEEDYDIADADGTHYSVFCHGGGLMIEDMQVYGASRGKTSETITVTATPKEGYTLGLDITDKTDLVGICYTMWFNAIFGDGEGKMENCPNVVEKTAKYGFSTEKGFGEGQNRYGQFHYWSEPAQGYYRSTDTDAIRNNMTLLYNAGVDFLILDYTYAGAGYRPGSSEWSSYIYKPMVALLDTIMQMRAEGQGTPYVVMWMSNDALFDAIYENFYCVEKWQDCFVSWNGKPFVMRWEASEDQLETEHFTVRGMYGLRGQAAPGQWTYLEVSNIKTVSYMNDQPEHVSVAVATQETYMSLPTAHGRQGGVFWYSQWLKAFDVHPKIVSVTWWNEWTAQLYYVENVGYIFTDNFNQEYSRDVEPMKGGHGDQYYRWLCEYIRAYRAGEDCPVLIEDGYETKADRALKQFKRENRLYK